MSHRHHSRRSHQCRGARARNVARALDRVASSPKLLERGPKLEADAQRTGALAAFHRLVDRQNKPPKEEQDAKGPRLSSRIWRRFRPSAPAETVEETEACPEKDAPADAA